MSWLSRYGRYWRSSRRHFKRWFISRRDGPLRPSDRPTDRLTVTHPVRHTSLYLLASPLFLFDASVLPPSLAARFHCRPSARPVRVVHFLLLDFAASLSGNRQYGGGRLQRLNETRRADDISAVNETLLRLLQSPTADTPVDYQSPRTALAASSQMIPSK